MGECRCGQNINRCTCNSNLLPACEDNGCNYQISTNEVFYKLGCAEPSELFALGLLNGTKLTRILESIDALLNDAVGYDFTGFSLYCLNEGMTIENIKDFSETISNEFCSLKNRFNNMAYDYNVFKDSLLENLNQINYLNINKKCVITITLGDSIKVILEKIVNYICSLNTCDNGSNLNDYLLVVFNNSNTIEFETTEDNLVIGNVVIDLGSDNCLLEREGLFVLCLILQLFQTLNYTNNILTISNGNNVTILTSVQSLAFNCNTKQLSISNGNSIDLSCISGGTSVNSDEKVKSDVSDLSSGYLSSKIVGNNSADINTSVSLNTTNHTVVVSSSVNYSALINSIISNLVLLQLLSNAVKLYITCFKYRITNTDIAIRTYSYKQCDGTNISNINIGLSSTVDVCALSVDTSSLLVEILILGNC